MDIRVGDIVCSLAGRDRGEVFLVVGEQGRFVLLANGKGRTCLAPKKKSRRHLSRIGACDGRAVQQLREGSRAANSEIRKALAEVIRPGADSQFKPEEGAKFGEG